MDAQSSTAAAPAPAPDRVSLALGLLIAAAWGALFHFWGNASDVTHDSRSLFVWLGRQLLVRGGDFSHGWLIPLVSGGLVVWQWRRLAEAPRGVSRLGLVVVLGALALHLAAYRAQQPRLSLVALVGLLWGLPTYLYGWAVGRLLLFPCAYLFLSFTAYVLVYFTFQLRLFSSVLAAWLLNGLGLAAERQGTAIYSAVGGGFSFDVADPCSGLRSLFVMTALAAPYAYLSQPTFARKWALFLLAVPLAMLSNTFRIVTVALAAQLFGKEFGLKVYHDYSGYVVFFLSITLLAAADTLLHRLPARRRRQAGGAAP